MSKKVSNPGPPTAARPEPAPGPPIRKRYLPEAQKLIDEHADLAETTKARSILVLTAERFITSKMAGDFRAYAAKCIYNALNKKKRTCRRVPIDELINPPSEDPTAALDAKMDVETLLATLPERDREIVKLHFLEGYRQAEIAAAMTISQQAVAAIIKKSLEKMRNEA
jgi:RNA polymerase sigma factor (sigma-70 family)